MREILDWTLADFRALPRLWMLDLRRKAVGFLLDHFSADFEAELAYRYFLARARKLGATIYCPAHDCSWDDCPKGCHDDD